MQNTLKKKKLFKLTGLSPLSRQFLFLSALFLLGVLAGCLTVEYNRQSFSAAGNELISAYSRFNCGISFSVIGFITRFLSVAFFGILIFLFGFSAFGVITVPAVTVIYGFAVSLNASLLLAQEGFSGFLSFLTVSGIELFLSLPFSLIICVMSYNFSKNIASYVFKRTSDAKTELRLPTKQFIISFASLFGIFALVALICCFICPILYGLI